MIIRICFWVLCVFGFGWVNGGAAEVGGIEETLSEPRPWLVRACEVVLGSKNSPFHLPGNHAGFLPDGRLFHIKTRWTDEPSAGDLRDATWRSGMGEVHVLQIDGSFAVEGSFSFENPPTLYSGSHVAVSSNRKFVAVNSFNAERAFVFPFSVSASLEHERSQGVTYSGVVRAVSDDGSLVVFARSEEPTLKQLVRVDNNSVLASFESGARGSNFDEMVFRPESNEVYALENSLSGGDARDRPYWRLLRVDSSGAHELEVFDGFSVGGLAVGKNRGVFIKRDPSGVESLVVFNLDSYRIIQERTLGRDAVRYATSAAISADENYYVVAGGSGLTIIDLDSYQVLEQTPVDEKQWVARVQFISDLKSDLGTEPRFAYFLAGSMASHWWVVIRPVHR